MVGVECFLLVTLHTLRTHNHFAHNLRHQRLGLVGSLLYLLVAYLYGSVEATQVGDNADTEGADAAMMGYNDFRDGRHADGVAAQRAIHLVFGRSLEGGPLYAYVDTIGDAYLLLLGNGSSLLDEGKVVGLVHVRETRTGREVLAAQRMLGEHVDMVGDNHQVANLEGGVHAAGSIADEERLDAQFIHHADGEGDGFHVVTLIIVEAALHGEYVYTAEFAEDELARVSLDGRHGEVGYFTVWELLLVSYFGS